MSTFTSSSSRLIRPRLLALVANCDNALNTYLHRRSTGIFVTTRRSICDLLLCRRMPISNNAYDPKSAGRRQLPIVSRVIPGVTKIVFVDK